MRNRNILLRRDRTIATSLSSNVLTTLAYVWIKFKGTRERVAFKGCYEKILEALASEKNPFEARMFLNLGSAKGVSITVPLTSCLTGLEKSCFANKNKNCCQKAYSKPVKQEINGTMILPRCRFSITREKA